MHKRNRVPLYVNMRLADVIVVIALRRVDKFEMKSLMRKTILVPDLMEIIVLQAFTH